MATVAKHDALLKFDHEIGPGPVGSTADRPAVAALVMEMKATEGNVVSMAPLAAEDEFYLVEARLVFGANASLSIDFMKTMGSGHILC